MGLTVRPYLAIIKLSVATGFVNLNPVRTFAHRLPLLAREINWMETIDKLGYEEVDYIALYSLEKLIEWKLRGFQTTDLRLLLSTR